MAVVWYPAIGLRTGAGSGASYGRFTPRSAAPASVAMWPAVGTHHSKAYRESPLHPDTYALRAGKVRGWNILVGLAGLQPVTNGV